VEDGVTTMTTAKEQLEQRDKILDEYEGKIGLPPHQSPGETEELEKYLTMDRKSVEALSSDECGIISYRLGQFAYHIQKSQNRELARVSWAKNEISLAIANELNNYKGYGYQEKSFQAIKDSVHATKLNQIMIFAEQRSVRLNFVATGLKNLADLIKSIQYNKRQNNVG
jgi:hypothetical protein